MRAWKFWAWAVEPPLPLAGVGSLPQRIRVPEARTQHRNPGRRESSPGPPCTHGGNPRVRFNTYGDCLCECRGVASEEEASWTRSPGSCGAEIKEDWWEASSVSDRIRTAPVTNKTGSAINGLQDPNSRLLPDMLGFRKSCAGTLSDASEHAQSAPERTSDDRRAVLWQLQRPKRWTCHEKPAKTRTRRAIAAAHPSFRLVSRALARTWSIRLAKGLIHPDDAVRRKRSAMRSIVLRRDPYFCEVLGPNGDVRSSCPRAGEPGCSGCAGT